MCDFYLNMRQGGVLELVHNNAYCTYMKIFKYFKVLSMQVSPPPDLRTFLNISTMTTNSSGEDIFKLKKNCGFP